MRKRETEYSPATLGHLLADGMDVWAYCNSCHHHAGIPLSTLIERLGTDFPVPDVGKLAKCSHCGAKECDTRPNWQGGPGVITRHT
jgi:hypothetical protein